MTEPGTVPSGRAGTPRSGLRRTLISWELVRYILQGAALNGAAVLVFAGLLALAPGVRPLLLNIATSALLFPVSFAVNRVWVFRSDGPLGPQIRRFLVVYVTAAAASALAFFAVQHLFHWTPVLIQVVVVAFLVVATFLLNALWTFARGHRPQADPPTV